MPIEDEMSEAEFPVSGVPQGSALGPLFIIYISVIVGSIQYCQCPFYADGTPMYLLSV